LESLASCDCQQGLERKQGKSETIGPMRCGEEGSGTGCLWPRTAAKPGAYFSSQLGIEIRSLENSA
jgi:hypothetical protein